MNELYEFLLYLSQRLDLRSSDKHFPLQNLSVYYTFELPDGSYSVSDIIQIYIEFTIKKHKTVTAILPVIFLYQ